jgi:hypothetical protein
MHAPLRDGTGKVRYFMGAQIDVSSVTDVSPELESLQIVIAQMDREKNPQEVNSATEVAEKKGEFQELVETLDMQELMAARTWQGRMLQEVPEGLTDSDTTQWHRAHIRDPSYDTVKDYKGTLDSLYNYVSRSYVALKQSANPSVPPCPPLPFPPHTVRLPRPLRPWNRARPYHGQIPCQCSYP